ncbi:MAG: signal peptidase I [Candidatus Aenigmarchaeota archaeon]|nr:signal peptidase I [Candidatus Aenigmarchaeota archaeon]
MPTSKKLKNADTKSTIIYILVGILLAVFVFFGSGAMLSTSTPIVAVESNSMQPTFSRGDILIIKGASAEEIKQGDIIVFFAPERGAPIVHRVVTRNADGTFQTKGDANGGQLPYEKNIQASQILGKEILILPLLGWVKIFITETVLPNAWVLIVVVVIVVFIYSVAKKKRSIHFSFQKRKGITKRKHKTK